MPWRSSTVMPNDPHGMRISVPASDDDISLYCISFPRIPFLLFNNSVPPARASDWRSKPAGTTLVWWVAKEHCRSQYQMRPQTHEIPLTNPEVVPPVPGTTSLWVHGMLYPPVSSIGKAFSEQLHVVVSLGRPSIRASNYAIGSVLKNGLKHWRLSVPVLLK